MYVGGAVSQLASFLFVPGQEERTRGATVLVFGNSYPKRGSDDEGIGYGGNGVSEWSCPSTMCSIVVDGPKKVGGGSRSETESVSNCTEIQSNAT